MLHQFPYGVPVPVQPPDFPLEFLKRIGFSGKRRTNAFVKPAFTLKGHVAYAVLLAYSVASVFSLKSERISPIFGIEKDCREYLEAKRLLKFLDYFVGIESTLVPANSLLREFIGGGCFQL